MTSPMGDPVPVEYAPAAAASFSNEPGNDTEWCRRCQVHSAFVGQLCRVCDSTTAADADPLPDSPGDRRAAFGEGPC